MKKIVAQNLILVKTVLVSTVIMGTCLNTNQSVLANHLVNNELALNNPLVYQLSDVNQQDWAFEALKQLIENYHINNPEIIKIFEHNGILSRTEFAVILQTTLNQLEQSLANHNLSSISPQDLTKIQKLQTQFATELAILRGSVDALEARVTEQELTQFSPTTLLTGIATFNLAGTTFSNQITAEGLTENLAVRDGNNQPVQRTITQGNITTSQTVELSLHTSFSGDDLLLTKLAMGNNNAPINELRSTGNIDTIAVPYDLNRVSPNFNDVILQELYYQFPVNDSLQMVIAPRINWDNYFHNLVNYVPHSQQVKRNLLSPIEQGTGIISLWKINDQLQLNTAYLKENNTNVYNLQPWSNHDNGIFSGTNSLTVQLTYSPSDQMNIELLYQRAFNLELKEGQLLNQSILGVADDGQGGSLKNANSHIIGLSLDWFLNPEMRIFGSYNYINTHLEPTNSHLQNGEINSQQLIAGVNVLDLGKEGTVTTLAYRIPFHILDGRKYLVAGGGNGATEQEFEASYYFPMTDYLSVIPTFYLILNPNQFSHNHNIYVGNLQMQLLF